MLSAELNGGGSGDAEDGSVVEGVPASRGEVGRANPR